MNDANGFGILRGLLAALSLGFAAQSAASVIDSVVYATEPVTPAVFEGSLLDLAPAQRWQPGMPLRSYPRIGAEQNLREQGSGRGYGADPLLARQAQQRQVTRTLGTTEVNVDGLPFGGGFPDDINGDVGRDFFIQSSNGPAGSAVRIFNKSTGARVGTDIDMKSIAAAVPGANPDCATQGGGDPVIVYDDLAGRWLFTQFTAEPINTLCVYVSRTSDPIAGGFYIYAFKAPVFPDYPKYGVWPNAYYAGTNENGTGFASVYAFQRSAMLAGTAAVIIRNTSRTTGRNGGFELLQPVDVDGSRGPAADAPGMFVQQIDDEKYPPAVANRDSLRIITFLPNFSNTAQSVLTDSLISAAEFDSVVTVNAPTGNNFGVIPQPGTTMTLDPLIDQVMNRAGYRNFGTHESIVGAFAINTNGGPAGIIGTRWFELRRTPAGSGGWSLFQQGTVGGPADGIHRWNAGINMDAGGNIGLAYAVSNSTVSPGLRYTGRMPSDAPGLMAPESVLVAGTESQTAADRWGDYASMSSDPVTGCQFWFTAGYMAPPPDNMAGSRVGAFRVENCTLDFGDAPDTFLTTAIVDGARHWIKGPRLGPTVSAETEGQPNATASGDSGDDGVSFNGVAVDSSSAQLVADVQGAGGRLDAWIDFNKNGLFEASERVANNVPVAVANNNTVVFTVPAGTTAGNAIARVRLSTAGVAGPNGLAPDGEVEDYQVAIQPAGAPPPPPPPPDTVPDNFTFDPVQGVEPNSVVRSGEITVSGINAPANISIVGGQFSVNGGAFTGTATTVSNGNKVRLSVTSGGENATVTATLTIGGVTGSFMVASRRTEQSAAGTGSGTDDSNAVADGGEFDGTGFRSSTNSSSFSVPAGYSFPLGFFEFTLTNVAPGGQATVVITLPDGVFPDAYVKCVASVCSVFPDADIDGNIVELTLTDGGPFDTNPAAGVIGDPGGPAVVAPVAAPASKFFGGLGALLLAPLALLAALRRILRQKQTTRLQA